MSYATILAGLHVRFATVAGINAILDYAPAAFEDPPLLYSLLDHVDIARSGQIRAVHYRIQHRMVFHWQDFEQAELEIIPFVDAIPLAVEADPHLGGVLVSGYAEINECDAGWINVGGVEYRILDFYSSIVEK
jgi:hypothetical protein